MRLGRYLLLAMTCGWCLCASAWNGTGHRVIATIAYEHLLPSTRWQVDELTWQLFHSGSGQQRFLRAAVLPDNLRKQDVTLFAAWHYINSPWSVDGSKTNAPAAVNLVTVLQQSMSIIPNRQINFALRTFMLTMLIHLVGDVEQPLHCINRFSRAFPEGDAGGNEFLLNTSSAHNLHEFWDQGLGLFYPQRLTYKAYALYIQQLARQFTQQYPPADFANDIQDMQPMDWAQASYQLAKNYSYDIAADATPSTAYIAAGRKIVARQSALAGYRLAAILNGLF